MLLQFFFVFFVPATLLKGEKTVKSLHKWCFFVFLSLCLCRSAWAQDATPPTQPATLTVTAVSTTQLDLAWSSATDNVAVTGYYVYRRSTSTGPDTLIYTTGNWTNFSNGMLLPGEKFWYSIKARDAAGNVSTASPLVSGRTLGADTTAPTAPPTLTVGAISTTQLDLVWGTATDNVAVTGYYVYRRSAADGPDTLIYTMDGNWTNYTNGSLMPGEKFWYSVKARDAAGNISGVSPLVSGRTLASASDASVPTQPTMTAVTAVSTSQLNLAWSAATDNVAVTGYRVYYRTTSTGADVLLSTLGNVLSASNTGLAPDEKRWYSVSALDAAGNEGAKSLLLSGRTLTTTSAADTTAPTAPSGPTLAVISPTQINVSWGASSDPTIAGQTTSGLSGYRVERCAGTGCTFFAEVTQPSSTSYNNTALTAASTYRYRVRATDVAGNLSAYSGIASATTTSAADTTAPTVAMTSPVNGAVINGAVTSCAGASDNVGVAGVQFKRDGVNLGAEVTASPYCVTWNTSQTSPGPHTLTATARDLAGNTATSASVAIYTGVRTDTLAWTVPNTTLGIIEYRVYYGTATNPFVGGTQLPVPTGTTTVPVSSLNWGTRYYYVVTAVYTPGESVPSNEASALK